MSKQQVMELAKKAIGDYSTNDCWSAFTEELVLFARLVEQATLERAASKAMMIATNGIETSAAIREPKDSHD